MKKIQNLVTWVTIFSLTSLPAFACGSLWAPFFDCFSGHSSPPPYGAPAPMLAAGLPAFLALGGGALVTKLFHHLRGGAE